MFWAITLLLIFLLVILVLFFVGRCAQEYDKPDKKTDDFVSDKFKI